MNSLLKTANVWIKRLAKMQYNADGSIICAFGEKTGENYSAPTIGGLSQNAFKALEGINENSKIPKFNISGKVFPGKCIGVYDGDTIHVAIAYGGEIFDFTIRMYGYNSAELKTKNAEEKEKGLAAKEFIKSLVLGKNVVVQMLGHDKYGGRWLGNVYLVTETGNKKCEISGCVNTMMVEGGHGMQYYGTGEKKY